MFYSEEALQKALKEELAKKPVTATDVKAAREKMSDAREQLARVQAGEYSHLSLQELREKAADAERHYHEVHRRGGHLEHAERAQAFEKQKEQAQQQAQAAFAQQQETEAREETSKRFIAAGGTPEQFARAWPGMWEQELVRRTQAGQDAPTKRLRASGSYQRI